MARRGGQPGNDNAHRAKIFRDGIRWALEHYQDENPLDKVVSSSYALYKMCLAQVRKAADEGDINSFRELADRTDGKPVQAIEGTGDDGVIRIIHESK